jgi:threonyl-tRNA synthetase
VRREISDEDALVELAGEPYKCELIGLKGGASEDAPKVQPSRSAAPS